MCLFIRYNLFFFNIKTIAPNPQHNEKQSLYICKYLQKYCGVQKVIVGGDIIEDKAPTAEKAIFELETFFKDFDMHDIYSVVGNHDFNNYQQNNLNAVLSEKEIKNIINSNIYKNTFRDNLSFYVDDDNRKCRFLFLNTAYKEYIEGQISCICNDLISTPQGYRIIVIAHIWVEWNPDERKYYTNNGTETILGLLDDYNNRNTFKRGNFREAKAKVILILGGHIHNEYTFKTESGIPVVIRDSDSRKKSCNHRKFPIEKTPSEQSLSVVLINKKNAIRVINIGRGTTQYFK